MTNESEIHNESELREELKRAREQAKEWLLGLKAARKRTFPYSVSRGIWQAVQRRMTGDFKYSREAEKLFHEYFAWEEKFAGQIGLRCVTTK